MLVKCPRAAACDWDIEFWADTESDGTGDEDDLDDKVKNDKKKLIYQ